jgi:hypothetical protein
MRRTADTAAMNERRMRSLFFVWWCVGGANGSCISGVAQSRPLESIEEGGISVLRRYAPDPPVSGDAAALALRAQAKNVTARRAFEAVTLRISTKRFAAGIRSNRAA